MVSLEEVFVNLGIDAEGMLGKNQSQETIKTETENNIPKHFLKGIRFYHLIIKSG